MSCEGESSWLKFKSKEVEEKLMTSIITCSYKKRMTITSYRDWSKSWEEVRTINHNYLDLAVLFGIRDAFYKQEYDKPLSEEELNKLEELTKEEHVHRRLDVEWFEKYHKNEYPNYESWKEKELRIREVGEVCEEDNENSLYLGGRNGAFSIVYNLSLIYKDVEFDLYIEDFWLDGEDYLDCDEHYLIKNGEVKDLRTDEE